MREVPGRVGRAGGWVWGRVSGEGALAGGTLRNLLVLAAAPGPALSLTFR
jgi:hypothetical protein